MTKEESEIAESNNYQFVRNSKFRRSIRIQQKVSNKKLPPSALIFMKSLERSTKNIKEPELTKLRPVAEEDFSQEYTNTFDCDETDETVELLIRRKGSKRSSIKRVQKSSSKKQKLNRFINFFR